MGVLRNSEHLDLTAFQTGQIQMKIIFLFLNTRLKSGTECVSMVFICTYPVGCSGLVGLADWQTVRSKDSELKYHL